MLCSCDFSIGCLKSSSDSIPVFRTEHVRTTGLKSLGSLRLLLTAFGMKITLTLPQGWAKCRTRLPLKNCWRRSQFCLYVVGSLERRYLSSRLAYRKTVNHPVFRSFLSLYSISDPIVYASRYVQCGLFEILLETLIGDEFTKEVLPKSLWPKQMRVEARKSACCLRSVRNS